MIIFCFSVHIPYFSEMRAVKVQKQNKQKGKKTTLSSPLHLLHSRSRHSRKIKARRRKKKNKQNKLSPFSTPNNTIMPRSSGVLSQTSTSRASRSRADPSSSQAARPSSSQQRAPPSQQNGAADDAELDQMVINLVKVVLNLSVNKHPIKKVDLVKNAFAGNSRIFPKVIEQAKRELTDVGSGYRVI